MKPAAGPLLLLLAGAAARAVEPAGAPPDPEAALGLPGLPALTEALRRAAAHEASGDLRKAEAGYALVLGQDPAHAFAALGLGRVRAARGNSAGAIAAWSTFDTDPGCVEALARFVEPQDPARAAALYSRLLTLRLGDSAPHLDRARALARVDPAAAKAALDDWLLREEGAPPPELVLAVSQALQAAGDADAAAAVLHTSLARDPDGPAAAEQRGRLDRLSVEEAAARLVAGGGEPLPAALRPALDAARAAMARGDLDAARDALDALLIDAPRAAAVRGALGDVLEQRGDIAGAEREYLWALALAPDDPEGPTRLGLLLARRYGGRRHREAAELLAQALVLRPGAADLWSALGEVRQQLGDFDGAVAAFEAVLSHDPAGPFAAGARAALDDLARRPPPPPALPTAAAPPAGVPPGALAGWRIARVYLSRGDLERARAELVAVRRAAPDWPAALHLEAALALRAGDRAAALAAWDAALALDPQAASVQLARAELLLQDGRPGEARAALEAAVRAGAPEAQYPLARLAVADGRWTDARDALDAFLASGAGGLHHAPARALRDEVGRRIALARAAAAALLTVTLTTLGLLVWRRHRAVDLAALARRAPESVPALLGHLGALRHEVLKHNTTLLDAVAVAIERGDVGAVTFAAHRLFGGPGEPRGGVLAHHTATERALVRLAAAHGLAWSPAADPILGPLRARLRALARLAPRLHRPRVGDTATAAAVRTLGRAINHDSYAALGQLLHALGTTDVALARCADVDARVRAEPAFADRPAPPLELRGPDTPIAARVLAADLDVVLANLLRNARAALAGAPAPRLLCALSRDEDPTTGHERLCLLVADTAPATLRTEDIRARPGARGLGLCRDLLARSGGTLDVVPGPPGFTKALRVRLHVAETEEPRE